MMRQFDEADEFRAGLAVCEHSPGGKSAEEIRALWQWVETRLGNAVTATEEPAVEDFVEIPAIIPKWAARPSFDKDSAHFLRIPARV